MRYIYPYNFVPPAEQPPRNPVQPTEAGIGSYRPFQPLDRHGKWTGRIEFTLTNLTPLFIPDPEGTTKYNCEPYQDGSKTFHRVMDFFNVDGRLCLPSTSLKGMFRSVAEALSNSTFGVFKPENKKYFFRKIPLQGYPSPEITERKWGIWRITTTDKRIEICDEAKILRSVFEASLGITTDEQRDQIYSYLRSTYVTVKAELWQLHSGAKHVRYFSGTYNGPIWVGGPPTPLAFSGTVFANIVVPEGTGDLRRRPGATYKTEIINAVTAAIKGPLFRDIRDVLHLGNGPGPWRVQFATVMAVDMNGVLEKRICSIDYYSPRDIRSYIWRANSSPQNGYLWPRAGWKDLEPGPTGTEKIHYVHVLFPTGKFLTVLDPVIQQYKDANGGEAPPVDRFIRYYAQDSEVLEIGPSAIFRTPERATVKDLAEKTPHIIPCKSTDRLCPASRLFGWSPARDENRNDPATFPVSGRVRAGVAWSDATLDDTFMVPLKTLGQPNPKYYPFYLRPANVQRNPSDIRAYYSTDTDSPWWPEPGHLRGRKFYIHHPASLATDPVQAVDYVSMKEEHLQPDIRGKIANQELSLEKALRSGQNSSAAVLPSGKTFKGYVEFDSLEDYELGLLLWAISLSDAPLSPAENERAHKLGLGRSLGLGSVNIKIDNVETWDPISGWSTDDEAGTTTMTAQQAVRLVRIFKTWMMAGIETENNDAVTAFDHQPFYQDLCAVLKKDLVPAGVEVQYNLPPSESQPYKGFKYFVKQRDRRRANQEQPLRSPMDILVNKNTQL